MEPVLVGRDASLLDLRTAIRDGGVVVVTGEPGIGKTRLVDESLRALDGASVVRVAAASSSSLPLGPFLDLIDPIESLAAPELTGLAAETCREIRRRAPAALVVDDAHELDPPSADLVGALAAGDTTIVLITSAPRRTPVAVRRLLRSARHVPVPPLGDDETAVLVASMLPGPVDPGLTSAVVSRSAGVPLIAVELVRYLVDRGLAAAQAGVWRGPERMPHIPALATMVDHRLLDADPAVRTAVEVIALADGLTLATARALVTADALEAAEDAGWLRVRSGGDPQGVVRVRHRLLAEAVGAAVPELRRRRLLERIADALPDDGDETGVSALRRARLRLDAGADMTVASLLALAEAVQVSDPVLSRRATDRASANATSVGDLLRIAGLHLHQHRLAETSAALARLEERVRPGPEHLEAALAGVFLLLMVRLRPAEALERLDDLEGRYGPLDVLRAHRSTALWLLGRAAEAAATAASVLDDPTAIPPARAHAAQTLASVSIGTGDAADFARAEDAILAMQREVATVLPETAEGLELLRVLHASDVDLDPAGSLRRAQPRYDAALRRADEGSRAQYATEIAWARVLAGRAIDAVPMLRAALPAQGMWTALTRPWVAARLLLAARAAGTAVDADALLELVTTDYFVEAVLARAAVADDAGEVLATAERRFATTGAHHAAAMVRYAAVRDGDVDAAHRFVRTPGRARPDAVAAMAAHAAAVAAGEGDELECAARALDTAGLGWFAATAQRQAVAAHLAAGDRGRVGVAAARLRRLTAGCPGESRIATPPGAALTPRELEIAELVAVGLSDRQVAERLALSVRTVHAHLGSVYRKTGVGGRRELTLLSSVERPAT